MNRIAPFLLFPLLLDLVELGEGCFKKANEMKEPENKSSRYQKIDTI
jgi:hypothetical protein